MKRTLLASAVLVTVMAASGQSKINPAGNMLIHEYNQKVALQVKPGLVHSPASVSDADYTVSAVLILRENADVYKVLEGYDAELLSEMEGVAVIACPISQIESIAEDSDVLQVGFGDKMNPTMDYARPTANVDEAQNGFTYNDQKLSFDGTGVVVGMMDIGLQPNHVNFKNSDGTSRIQRLWHMSSSNGTSRMYTAQTIGGFECDTRTESHGTHVAGIMGGSYKGTGRFMKLTSATSLVGGIQNSSIPFYGVATGCDLALNCGNLYSPNIVQAVTNVIEYAESEGKPSVVNLSLGSNIGPHDGTDYISAALARLGQRGIICISAGNEGDENISITKTLSSTGAGRYLQTFLGSTEVQSAVVDLWTNGSEAIPVSWGYYSTSTRKFTPMITVTEAGKTVYSSSSTVFSQYFYGSITMTSNVNTANNRFNVQTSLMNIRPKSGTQNVYLAFQAGGDDLSGTALYLFTKGTTFTNKPTSNGSTVTGYSAGTPANSINNDACGDNVISVGAFSQRNVVGLLNGSGGNGAFTVGQIASFSSYGTSYQGRKLPMICGPGTFTVSSYNRYYVELLSNPNSQMTGSAANGSATDYWGQMSGTSMSCPFVTGTVALWLEANPNLTYDQIIDVMENSSEYNELQMKGGRWGYGKIKAVEGLKYILQNHSAIGSVWDDDSKRFMVSPAGEGYDVTLAGEADFEVALVDLQGRTVATAQGSEGAAYISTSGLQAGIYVLTAQGASTRQSTKVTVK